MKTLIAFILAMCIVAMTTARNEAADAYQVAGTPGGTAAGQYYCPPGAKFCPAPGTDNTVFLDTHFGMDAKTGEVVAYRGTTHPDDVLNPPMTGEAVLYVSPPISVENRHVPYPGSPQIASATTLAQPTMPYAGYDQFARPQSYPPASSRTYPETHSEVANTTTNRESRQDAITEEARIPWWKGGLWANDDGRATEGDRIPWWKGGLWRNRQADADDNDDYDAPPPARRNTATAATDDMWDDDEYTGYNPDGSVGRQNYGGQQGFAPAASQDPFAANGNYYAGAGGPPQQQYYDGYSQPQSQYYDPYGQGAPAQSGPVYAGQPYTLPNSPPPTSPYQNYPAAQPYQGGYTASPAPYADPVLTSSAMPPANDSFLPPPPASAQAESGSGSAQFENAVRMVKEGRFSEAKELLTTETRNNPSNAAGWRWLGDCHYNLLELDAAISTYQRALDRDPNDYYALRGQGFSYLHRGHEFWRRMQEEVAMGQKDQAANTFTQAHDNYKKSLELLGFCLRRAPNDSEAVYGEAMAAEGASRKLYSNAISFLKLGPENRERAELFAENCLTVIQKGVERARERAQNTPGESGPRALLGGLYLRKAILLNQLGKQEMALIELKNSRDVQQSILDEIDKNNATAQKGVRECESYWEAWGGTSQGSL